LGRWLQICGFRWPPSTRSRGTAHARCQFCVQNGPFTLLSSLLSNGSR